MPIFQNSPTLFRSQNISRWIGTLPEKLGAIRNLAPAKKVEEAHQILGLLGYYRLFVPAFSDMTLPITSLLKKNTPFVWSEKCQLALNYLNEIFWNKPILQFPGPNKPYVLFTDASNNAYSNHLMTTMILGQLHIFQVALQHKT